MVQYAYTEMADGDNNSRLTSITYPNGRPELQLHPGLDDSISRLTRSRTLPACWKPTSTGPGHRGGARPSADRHQSTNQPDRSGRRRGRPVHGPGPLRPGGGPELVDTNTGTATDDFQYGYDPDGDVLCENNLVNSAFSEEYSTTTSTNWRAWRGAGRPRAGASTRWATGPCDDGRHDADAHRQCHRTNHRALGRGGDARYDNDGNLTTDPTNGDTYVYDAWNRLVAVKNDGTTLASYSYDALGHRITETSTATLDLYFSKDWQVVEEQAGGVMQAQYVWSPVYVDAMVEAGHRRRHSAVRTAGCGLERHRSGGCDRDGAGAVCHHPYGQASFLAADWSSRDSSSVNLDLLDTRVVLDNTQRPLHL